MQYQWMFGFGVTEGGGKLISSGGRQWFWFWSRPKTCEDLDREKVARLQSTMRNKWDIDCSLVCLFVCVGVYWRGFKV